MPSFRRTVQTCLAVGLAAIIGSIAASSAQEEPRKGSTIEDILIGAGLSTIFGHKQPNCKVTQSGWIEPTQGVWQDDDFFEDRPGKQLTQVDPRSYNAELKMARSRDTLLYGILRPAGQQPSDRREAIVISGESFYSNTIAVKIRITVKQRSATHTIYESPLDYHVNLGGGCLPVPVPFAAVLNAGKGIPPPPADPFIFGESGPYTIKAELVDAKNHPTGLYTQVSGEVVETAGPIVQFAPVYSGRQEARPDLVFVATEYLTNVARSLARNVPRYGPMYFPIAPDDMAGIVRAPRDVDGALAHSRDVAESKIKDWTKYLLPVAHALGVNTGNADPDVVAAQLYNDFEGEAGLGHVGRLVVLTRDDIPGLLHDNATAFTFSTKVIFARAAARQVAILHEIVHTEPTYLWSSPNMLADCGHDYHDTAGSSMTKNGVVTQIRGITKNPATGAQQIIGVAYGVRTQHLLPFEAYSVESDPGTGKFEWLDHTDKPPVGDESSSFNGEGVPQIRQRLDAKYELMGAAGQRPDVPDFRWITQCTYHHLVDDAMQQSQDPHYLLVRTVLAHGRDNWYGGYLEPVYDVEDTAIVAKPGGGPWSVTARDSAGTAIATYGFTVNFKNSDSPRVRNAIPYTIRVPYAPNIATLDLLSPMGKAATLAVSATAPTLLVSEPADGGVVPAGQPVTVRWSGASATGAPLVSSVFYSPDGKNWLDRVFETKQTSARIFLARNVPKHYIRVVVSDGTRSSERTVIVTAN